MTRGNPIIPTGVVLQQYGTPADQKHFASTSNSPILPSSARLHAAVVPAGALASFNPKNLNMQTATACEISDRPGQHAILSEDLNVRRLLGLTCGCSIHEVFHARLQYLSLMTSSTTKQLEHEARETTGEKGDRMKMAWLCFDMSARIMSGGKCTETK